MIFEFSTSPETPTVTINYPARHDFPQMIHLNPVNESRQGNNRLLQQQEYAIYSTITKHHFVIQQDAKLCMRSDVPLINLFYTLKGRASVYHEQLGIIHLDEGYYFLYYLPAGEHPVQITTSDCVTMKVEIDMKMLATLKDQHPYLAQFHKHSQETPTVGWRLPRMPTCTEGKRLLKNITNSKLEHVKRAMFMHRSVAMLLALYIDDLSRTNQDATPRYIFNEDEMARLRAMVEVLGTAKYRKFSARKVARIFGFSYCKAVEGIRWICNGKDIRTITNERIADEIAQRLIETNDGRKKN